MNHESQESEGIRSSSIYIAYGSPADHVIFPK